MPSAAPDPSVLGRGLGGNRFCPCFTHSCLQAQPPTPLCFWTSPHTLWSGPGLDPAAPALTMGMGTRGPCGKGPVHVQVKGSETLTALPVSSSHPLYI